MNTRSDAGITIQDALFNGVITLLALAALVAVYLVVHNQFVQSQAAQDFMGIVAGVKSANGGDPEYYGFNFAQVKSMNDLPTDDVPDSTATNYLVVPWNTSELASWVPTGTSTGLTIEVPFSDVGTCAAVMSAAASSMYMMGNTSSDSVTTPSQDYYYNGAWQNNAATSSPWTPQAACADALTAGVDFYFR